jgi:hypothetical protein
MKRIILEILDLITSFFNKIIDREAERVNEFYKYIFASDLKERG